MSKKRDGLEDIDEIVDKIILKYKDKLGDLHSKEIDIESFSLKNKKTNTLYYLKKKSDKKIQDTTESNVLSNEIITEARENLGEDPLEEYKLTEENDEESIDAKKKKKRIKFRIFDKKTDDIKLPPTTEDIVSSKEFDDVISEIDDFLKDEKVMEKHKTDDSSEKKDEAEIETKVAELMEQKDIHSDEKTDKNEDDWVSSSTDGLAGLKKKYDGKISFSDSDFEEPDKSVDSDLEVLDQKIKEESNKKAEEGIGASKPKKSFFKKKKPSNNKLEYTKQDESFEITDEKPINDTCEEDAIKLAEQHIKETHESKTRDGQTPDLSKPKLSLFKNKTKTFYKEPMDQKKIDADPKLDDVEMGLLDNKIKDSRENEVCSEKMVEGESNALKFAERHIKDTGPKKSFFRKDKPKQKTPLEQKPNENKLETPMIQPIFRVENLPQSNELSKDEKEIVDAKIKGSSETIDTTASGNKAEAKAAQLAEEHLKNKTMPSDKDKSIEDKKVKQEPEMPSLVSLGKADSEHEHIFFDEDESSSGGWTPQIPDEERKKMIIGPTHEGEISSEDMKGAGDVELPKEVLKTKSVKLSDLGFSEKEWEELDFYPLYEPFSYVEILREKESLDKCYFLVEMALNEEEEKILGFIEDTMSSQNIDTIEFDEKNPNEYLLEKLDEVISEYNVEIGEQSKNKIYYYMSKKALGLGKIDPLMKDPNIEDISCDGAGVPLFLYHRKYGSLKSNIRFNTEDDLSSFVFKLAQKCGKHISIAEPMLDATMPDGSRIQMTLSDEITAKGSTFTIRKFRDDPFSPPDLAEFNTMSSEMIAYMWMAVENGVNTLFAGGTASGKTTALNALALFIPRESKIVSIEETREINLPHPNWIPGVARSGFGEVVADKVVGEIDLYDLMKAALRQRPEYILVGEIRGREAYVLFQAMATGHATYSTAHADSAQSLIHRLEGKPINIPRIMLQSLDIVCLHVITRVKNIRARRCKQIIEIIDIDPTTKEILTNEVFRWDPVEDKFVYSGKSYVLERIRAEKDLTREEMTAEIRNRMKIIDWMNENNIREFRDVSKIVSQYTEAPEELLTKLKDVKIDE